MKAIIIKLNVTTVPFDENMFSGISLLLIVTENLNIY